MSIPENKIIIRVKNFVIDHKPLCVLGVLYIVTVIVGLFYSPWQSSMVDNLVSSGGGVVGVSGIFSTVATCGYGSVERFDVELTTDGPPLAAPPGKNIAKPTSKIVRATIPITVSRKRRLAFATCASLSRAVSHNVPAQITPIVPATAMPALMTVVTVCAMPLVPPQKTAVTVAKKD